MKKKMKAIEPLIAVIILIAVTVVIAIAVVGFIMGWWGTFGATEQVRILPDSKLKVSNNQAKLELNVKNEGTAAAVIYKVEIEGIGEATIEGNREVTIQPGENEPINATINRALTPGASYKVNVYTKAGNVASIILRAVLESPSQGSQPQQPQGTG